GDVGTALRLAAAAEVLRGSFFRPVELEHVDHDRALQTLGPAGYDRARAEGAAMTPAGRRQLVRAVRVR
ncbi:MAG TPA: hypothetical protein VGV86_01530, partial [Acidimicrobiales bacterium]|nr:hypothetical protein [Acidimicrobiales bacterium]